MIEANVTVTKNILPRIESRFAPEIADTLNTGVFDLVAAADPRTPVDTGDLKNKKQLDMASGGNLSASVTWTMDYAAYVDQGTVYQAPQPYATTTADAVFPGVIANLTALEGRLT